MKESPFYVSTFRRQLRVQEIRYLDVYNIDYDRW